jgi:hypothetical protein
LQLRTHGASLLLLQAAFLLLLLLPMHKKHHYKKIFLACREAPCTHSDLNNATKR